MAASHAVWWWPFGGREQESADVIANRLDHIADELEDATTELRSIVTGLRDVHVDPTKGRRGSGEESK